MLNQVRRPSGGDSRGPALPKPRRAQKLDEEPLYDKVHFVIISNFTTVTIVIIILIYDNQGGG